MFRRFSAALSQTCQARSALYTHSQRNMALLTKSKIYQEVNGVPVEVPASTTHEAIVSYPSGPYTVMKVLTHRGDRVFRLSQHISRIYDGARGLLNTEDVHIDSPLASELQMSQYMRQSIRNAIHTFRSHQAYTGDLRVLFLLSPSAAPQYAPAPANMPSSLATIIHIMPMPPPAPFAKAVAVEGHREHAEIKDSAWAKKGDELLDLRERGEDEAVLVHNGVCLEGVSSNFFAIMADGTVRTAGEGVLPGTVRELALEACAKEGVTVVEDAPLLASVETWSGAALTSTSRLWLPLSALRVHPSAGPSRTISFDCGPDSVAWRIQRAVERLYNEQCEEL